MQTAIMDSSPQPAPVRRPLKRSASTASLPTPPYTREHRKRRPGDRDRDNQDELDDDASDAGLDEEDEILEAKADRKGTGMLGSSKPKLPPLRQAAKKRVKLDHDEVSHETKDVAEVRAVSAPEEIKPAPLSPPRSRRQTQPPVVIPRTPPPRKAKKVAAKPMPVRGSPGNPFLDDDAGTSKDVRPPPRRDSEEYEEKATVTYVFRGVKATFENPLYKVSPTAIARSKLPLNDPDFSPDPIIRPKRLLFNQEDDDDEDTLGIKPTRLFTSAKPKAAAAKPKTTTAKPKAATTKPKAADKSKVAAEKPKVATEKAKVAAEKPTAS